jgi:hypothetical protein
MTKPPVNIHLPFPANRWWLWTFAKNIRLVALLAVVFIAASVLADDRPMNEMPMYGGQHNPEVEPDAAHSAEAAKLGWRYLDQGDDVTAIKRFN